MNRLLTNRWTKTAAFLLSLTPALLLFWHYQHNQLGINWVEKAEHITGDWALRFLLLSLLITPLRKLTGWSGLIRFRRMLGLYAFFYAVVHLGLYSNYDKGWDWLAIQDDFLHRRFFLAGMLAFMILLPLALTSTAASIRLLGGKRWQLLHRLVYVAAIAAVVHYYLQGKSFRWDPVIYGAMLAVLLLYRVAVALRGPKRKPAAAPASAAKAKLGA